MEFKRLSRPISCLFGLLYVSSEAMAQTSGGAEDERVARCRAILQTPPLPEPSPRPHRKEAKKKQGRARGVLIDASALERPSPAPPAAEPPPSRERLSARAQKSLELKRQEFKQNVELARTLFQQEQYSESAKLFALSYAFDPQPQLLYESARAYQRANLDSEALLAYDRFLQGAPTSPLAAEARTHAKELCDMPAAGPPLFSVAQSYVAMGKQNAKQDEQRSIEGYATAYSLDGHPGSLFNIGQAYRRFSKPEEAYLFYGRYLVADSADRWGLGREARNHRDSLIPILNIPLYRKGKFWGTAVGVTLGVTALTLGLVVGLRDDRETLNVQFQGR